MKQLELFQLPTMGTLYQGDALETLQRLPDGLVHTCVTSPPYWGLRDYGAEGQIGLEETPEEYVEKIVEVFREVRRVLRDDGTLWLNLGDSYASKPCGGIGHNAKVGNTKKAIQKSAGVPAGLKPKDLVGIPWRVALALQADGWYLRSDIIWHKPNAMPESVKDRPTKAHEYVFLLSKSPRYYYDGEEIQEPLAETTIERSKYPRFQNSKNRKDVNYGNPKTEESAIKRMLRRGKRNKRTVWTVATRPFKGAHFAVFPPDLIEPCILAGAPEKACPHCGAPWRREVEREPQFKTRLDAIGRRTGKALDSDYRGIGCYRAKFKGWKPTCQCENNDGSGRGIVLDPFFGSGTTGLVAQKHGRKWVGIELNPEYIRISRERLGNIKIILNEFHGGVDGGVLP